MDCFACGKDAGYNRAIVDLFSGTETGRFCLRCEREVFGTSLHWEWWEATERCTFCSRDGHYALALYLPTHEECNGKIRCSAAYEVTDTTLLLCDEHLHRLRDGDGEQRSGTPSASERR